MNNLMKADAAARATKGRRDNLSSIDQTSVIDFISKRITDAIDEWTPIIFIRVQSHERYAPCLLVRVDDKNLYITPDTKKKLEENGYKVKVEDYGGDDFSLVIDWRHLMDDNATV